MNFVILSGLYNQDDSLYHINENITKSQILPKSEALLVPSVSKKGHPSHPLPVSFHTTTDELLPMCNYCTDV